MARRQRALLEVALIATATLLIAVPVALPSRPLPPPLPAAGPEALVSPGDPSRAMARAWESASDSLPALRALPYANNSVLATINVGMGVSVCPFPPTYDPSNNNIYLPECSNVIAVIGGSNHTLFKNILVGSEPNTPLYDPSNGDLYSVCWGSNELCIVSGNNNSLISTIPLGLASTNNVPTYDPSNGDIYIASQLNGVDTLFIISGANNSIVATIPVASDTVTYDPANQDIYAPTSSTCCGSVLEVISSATNSIVATISVATSALTYDSANQVLYAADTTSHVLDIINGSTNQVTGTVPLPTFGLPPIYDSVNHDLYVSLSTYTNPFVEVVATPSNTVIGQVATGGWPQVGTLDTGADEVYVASAFANNVTVVSGSTNRWAASIPLGSQPSRGAYDPASSLLYFSNYYDGTMSVVSDVSHSVVALIPSETAPHPGCATPTSGEVFVLDAQWGTIGAISESTNSLVAHISSGNLGWATPACVPSTGEIYVPGDNGTGMPSSLTTINGNTNSVIANVTCPAPIYSPTYDPVNGDLYVPVLNANITVVSTATHRTIGIVAGTKGVQAVAYDPVNGQVYGTLPNSVEVVSTSSNTVLYTVPVGSNPLQPVIDPLSGNVYVPNFFSNNLTVISGTTNAVLATIALRGSPQQGIFDAANGDIYVVGNGPMNVISPTTQSVVEYTPLGSGSSGIIYDNWTGDLYLSNQTRNAVQVISSWSNTLLASVPTGIDPQVPIVGATVGDLYVPNSGDGTVSVIGVRGTSSLAAQASANRTSGPVPLAVSFLGGGTGGAPPYAFSWSFGDGGTSAYHAPSHVYNSTGTFPARFTVTDSTSRTASAWANITVTSPASLSAAASALPTSGQLPLSVAFSGSAAGGSPPYTWAWAFGDGGTAATENASHTYTTAGTFAATLTVRDSASHSVVKWLNITATRAGGGPSRWALTFTDVPTMCPLTFNGTTQANGTSATFLQGNYTAVAPACSGYFFSEWRWQIGSLGAVATQNPFTLDVTANGTLKVIYVAKTAWKDSIAFSVNHASCSPVQFNGSAVANGSTVQYWAGTYAVFAPQCAGYPSADWAYQPTGSTIRWNYSAWANITVFANGTIDAFYWTSPLPLTVALQASATNVATGNPVTLTPTISGGVRPDTCTWALNGTNTSQTGCSAWTTTLWHGGSYGYRVWATDSQGHAAGSPSTHVQVTWSPYGGAPPLVAFSNGTVVSGFNCNGGGSPTGAWTESFSGNARGGVAPYTFAWTFGDGTTGATGRNASHSYSTGGAYTASLLVTDAQGRHAWANVSVNAEPPPCPPPTQGFSILALSPIMSLLLVAALVAVAVLVPLAVLWRRRRGRGPPPPEPGPAAPLEERPPSP